MNKKATITTLIFDFGGVLINLDIQQCIADFKNLGVENVERFLSNYGQSGFFLEWERGDINPDEFRSKVRAICTGNPTDEEIDQAWMSFLLDIPVSKIEILKKLRSRYRILMLSNTNPVHIERSAAIAFGAHGATMQELFDRCYLSYQIGLTKPDPAIFDYLLQKEGLKAEECLFLDDGLKNIQTAEAMGFQTRLLEPEASLDFLLQL
ncbi:MAG: HAD family phosphatase [Paludibacter sp.]|jgi:putative hydrolase of the HAD superfamily|nr:HAD family phosphatase [Paludibacter sp.]